MNFGFRIRRICQIEYVLFRAKASEILNPEFSAGRDVTII